MKPLALLSINRFVGTLTLTQPSWQAIYNYNYRTGLRSLEGYCLTLRKNAYIVWSPQVVTLHRLPCPRGIRYYYATRRIILALYKRLCWRLTSRLALWVNRPVTSVNIYINTLLAAPLRQVIVCKEKNRQLKVVTLARIHLNVSCPWIKA